MHIEIKHSGLDPDQNEVVHLLWTGGWDSSFRLLQLLTMYRLKVQPYYIIDPDRENLFYELRSMQTIRKNISDTFSNLSENLLPTFFVDLQNIPLDNEIIKSLNRIREANPLGEQYDWLSSFVSAYNIKDLEISLEKGGHGIFNFLRKKFIYIQENGLGFFRLDPKCKDSDEYRVFHNFRFPLMETTKLDMERISSEQGFYHILNSSWFCHHPRRNGKPCGVCIPCMGAVDAGMRYRLPRSGRLRYRLRNIISKENFKKAFPRLHGIARTIKQLVKPK